MSNTIDNDNKNNNKTSWEFLGFKTGFADCLCLSLHCLGDLGLGFQRQKFLKCCDLYFPLFIICKKSFKNKIKKIHVLIGFEPKTNTL